jgi:Ni/Fe-hydrogenase 1 B-type cytochrome subunit
MGGEMGVRFWHHLFLWFFVTFVIVHIYLSFYHDYIEGRGTVSSIIGGWKFDRVEEAGSKGIKEQGTKRTVDSDQWSEFMGQRSRDKNRRARR